MPRSFGLVDYKVQEAEYFLLELRAKSKSFNVGSIQFCTSAFVSAARSITFAMQGCLKGHSVFDGWYKQQQESLRRDPLARFFQEFRTVTQHLGVNVVAAGIGGRDFHRFYFMPCPDLPNVPSQDVLSACEAYFVSILSLVFDCYVLMGPVVNGQWYFTKEHFASRGLSIEDAEEELGFARGYTDIGQPDQDPYRWQLMRRQADGCLIEEQFSRWLGKQLPQPCDVPEVSGATPKSDC
jgi:hypothetical protein